MANPARPVVCLPGALDEPPQVTLLAPLAEPIPAPVQLAEAGSEPIVTVECGMSYMPYLVLEW